MYTWESGYHNRQIVRGWRVESGNGRRLGKTGPGDGPRI